MNKLYATFYCMIKDDGTNTVHSRIVYLIEIFLTLVFISLSEVILGLLNIRLESFFYYILIMLSSPVAAYLLVKNMFSETKGKDIIQNFSEPIRKNKRYFALLAIGLLISSFFLLIICGMFMSYLFSLYEQ